MSFDLLKRFSAKKEHLEQMKKICLDTSEFCFGLQNFIK